MSMLMPHDPVLAFLLIFGLRVIDVSMGTIRTVYIYLGKKALSTIIGFFEVTIFIFAVSSVVSQVGKDWYLMFAYSGGFAAGTLLGILLENKFAVGFSQVRVISRDKGKEIAENLWANNYGATIVKGEGKNGAVEMVLSVIPRKQLKKLQQFIDAIDDESFIIVSDSRHFVGGYMGDSKRK